MAIEYESKLPAPAGDPEPGNPIAAALCVVGAGLIGIGGALLIGLNRIAEAMQGGHDNELAITGMAMLVVALLLLIVAIIKWIKAG